MRHHHPVCLQLVCDTNGIHEGGAVVMDFFFMERSSAAALSGPLCMKSTSSSNSPRTKRRLLISKLELVKNISQTSVADDVIDETDADLLRTMNIF